MAQPRILAEWELVTSYLPSDWQSLADEYEQVETKYGNAKIRTASELLRMILVHAACDLPLRETVALVAEAGGPDIAPMRLHKKMIRAVDYLRELVTRMVQDLPETSPELWAGYDVVVVDATTASRPGSLGADVRVHTLMRLSNLEYVDVQVTNTKVGETFAHFPLEFGQLVIGDRGYSFASSIFGAAARGADVLVRLNRGSTPLLDRASNERIDVLGAMRDLVGHAVVERDVVIEWTGPERREHRLDARLILQRLPESEAAKARKRLRDELGADATADSLEAAGYVALPDDSEEDAPVGRALHGPVSPTLADRASLQAPQVSVRPRSRTELPAGHNQILDLREAARRTAPRPHVFLAQRGFSPEAHRHPRGVMQIDPSRANRGNSPACSCRSSSRPWSRRASRTS